MTLNRLLWVWIVWVEDRKLLSIGDGCFSFSYDSCHVVLGAEGGWRPLARGILDALRSCSISWIEPLVGLFSLRLSQYPLWVPCALLLPCKVGPFLVLGLLSLVVSGYFCRCWIPFGDYSSGNLKTFSHFLGTLPNCYPIEV